MASTGVFNTAMIRQSRAPPPNDDERPIPDRNSIVFQSMVCRQMLGFQFTAKTQSTQREFLYDLGVFAVKMIGSSDLLPLRRAAALLFFQFHNDLLVLWT